jgi:glycosyltransferase involved in cell wall biosynthesis
LENHLKEIRVLMIGPGEGVGGGISALIETFLPVLEKQVSVRYLPSVKQRQLKDSGKWSARNLMIAFSQYVRFLAAMFRFRPHIIHLHTSQGVAWLKDTFFVVAGKVFRVHVILHMHGGNFDAIYAENPRLIQNYTRMILDFAVAVISVSVEWKTRLAKLIPAARVFPFKNCIDVQIYHPQDIGSPDRSVNILFLGRIGPLKGAFDLIEAVHCLPPGGCDFHVYMVGPEERDGDFHVAQDLLEKYQLSGICELSGSVPRETVLQLFNKASIFVLPSYYEGLPMAILEALAAGLPVIATPVGGIPEVVQDAFNGFLLAPGDIQALKGALEKLVMDADLRKIMGDRSRKIAERDLDVAAYVENLTALYLRLKEN